MLNFFTKTFHPIPNLMSNYCSISAFFCSQYKPFWIKKNNINFVENYQKHIKCTDIVNIHNETYIKTYEMLVLQM